MSYDLQIWSAKKLNFQDEYFQTDSFKLVKDSLVFESKEWQIVISESCEVDEEDVVPEIFSLLPGIKYLTEINLEPITAPKKAINYLKKVSKYIAKTTYGVVVDEQIDVVETPSGIKRVENFTIKENKKVVSMSWWFNDDSRLRKEGLTRISDINNKTAARSGF